MTRILVIEDEPNVRANLVEILQLMNFDVRGAADGIQGIQTAQEFLPNLVLCDVRMPGADGFEVLQTLRANPDTANMIIIMLTAHTDVEMKERGIAEGADAFLTKPIAVDDLIACLRDCLGETPVSDS